ncbi:glycosyltransferase family 39 protein [Candidatus Microgenomates bacterium]|nr:glycosyltransferase family 39 protein [Candidatus Microgenomates bacterium]
MKKVVSYFGGKTYFWCVVAIIVCASFLRLYQLPQYATFLGDQGRDAIVMKDIITFKDFTALGPITSVGSIYLGPFYYYLMAPWIGLFGLDPVGPAYGVALISIIGIMLQYLAVKDIADRQTALISIALTAFSWVLIEYSRFSWNPNLLAPASFFVLYVLTKAIRTKRVVWYAALGALLSAIVQLHYLALFLVPFSGIAIVLSFIHYKKTDWPNALKNIVICFAAFTIVISPFILFEIKHHFPNVTSAINFSRENSSKSGTSNPLNEFVDTSSKLITYSFQVNEPGMYATWAMVVVLFITPFIFYFHATKKKLSLSSDGIFLLTLGSLFFLIGTSLYHGPKYPHYLGGLYILLYVQLAYLLRTVAQGQARIVGRVVVVLLLAVFVVFNAKHYIFLYQKRGPEEIARARAVAQTVADMKPVMPYTLTSSPQAYADYTYRYFLDAWGLKPVPKEQDINVATQTLFVVCEKQCDPMKDSQWAIAHFSPRKITDEKKSGDMYIYRLIK